MTIFDVNKLYGLPLTENNLNYLEKYPYSFANSDHILIISPNKPCDDAIELTEEDYELLQQDDWDWIYAASDEIRIEQEKKYHDELMEKQNAFLDKFEEELRKAKENADRTA